MTGQIEGRNDHRKSFPEIVKEVIKKADIILEVLDARFIEDTRNFEIEEIIKRQGKKLIYVLNKADLIETSQAKEYMEQNRLYPYVFVSCKEREGSRQLRDRIKIEANKVRKAKQERIRKEKERARKIKEEAEPNVLEAIPQIGVIGYPNTGKSSVINLLIGKASAKTASKAGCTRGIQKIKLTEDIFIIDTPGVLQSKERVLEKTDITKQVKVGARDFDRVKNPENIVADLMQHYPQVIENHYHLDVKGDSEQLIEQLGRKRRFLKKGDEVDIDRTCRFILREWQEGKIRIN